jgi:hypothetical protein
VEGCSDLATLTWIILARDHDQITNSVSISGGTGGAADIFS